MTKVEVVRSKYAQKLKLIISDSLSRKHEQELRRDDPRRCDRSSFVVKVRSSSPSLSQRWILFRTHLGIHAFQKTCMTCRTDAGSRRNY